MKVYEVIFAASNKHFCGGALVVNEDGRKTARPFAAIFAAEGVVMLSDCRSDDEQSAALFFAEMEAMRYVEGRA